MAWENTPQNNGQIFFTKSTDGGNSFNNSINLGNNTGFSGYPQIAVSENDNNYVYVVWRNAGNGITFRKSTDGGNSFGSIINLSGNNNQSAHDPQITVSKINTNKIYAVWDANSTSNSKDVFLKQITTVPHATKNTRNTFDVSENVNKYFVGNSTELASIRRIALVRPTFTAAYDNAFYIFYKLNANATLGDNITKHIGLLSNALLNKTISETASSIVLLGHQEYVTQNEYDNLRQFVKNGGTLIILDGNIFYAEVKYDKNTQTITLDKGHGWTFNGKSAWKSIPERWKNETSEWVGSNFLCYLCHIRFNNNPFGYQHSEEQYITNPKDKILLDYNASIIEYQNSSNDDVNNDDKNTITYNNTNFNTTSQNQATKTNIATYELDFGRGKVISLGIYADDIIDDYLFNKFLDSLLFKYASKER